jgi:hypothetical protein
MAEGKPTNLLGYNVYLLDPRGRISTAQRLQAASDECALWMLRNLAFTHKAELWRGGRRIATIAAADTPE